MSKRSERRKKAKTKKVEDLASAVPKLKNPIIDFYDKKYKLLLLIPAILLILSIAQISFQTITTGDFINKGVSLSGGITISIEKELSIGPLELERFLNEKFQDEDSSVREITSRGNFRGLVVESTLSDSDQLIGAIEEKTGVLASDEFTKEVMGPSLGEQFFKQTFRALIFAFVLMGVVVFFYFRSFVPSLAVILSAFFDIIVTAAIVNVIGIQLSTAGVAAFLMLIGYSVDTDILLSSKMLKGKGSMLSRIKDAMKTGLVMTATTIIAVLVALLVTQSIVIKQILLIVLIGLLVDTLSTWVQNAGIIRWYLEK